MSSLEADEKGAMASESETDHKSDQKISESPTPSCLSMMSNKSMDKPTAFSMDTVTESKSDQKRSESPTPSCLSMKSNKSMDKPTAFSMDTVTESKSALTHSLPAEDFLTCDFCLEEQFRAVKYFLNCSTYRCVKHVGCHYMTSALQTHLLMEVAGDQEQNLCQLHHRPLQVFCRTDQKQICTACAGEEHKGHNKFYMTTREHDSSYYLNTLINKMTADELKYFIKEQTEHYPDCLGSLLENLAVSDVVEKMVTSFGEVGAVRITLHYLAFQFTKLREANKENMRLKCQQIPERTSQGEQIFLNEIYTELFITEGESGEVNTEHEVRQTECLKHQTSQETQIEYNEIFKTLSGERGDKKMRTVLTKGIAGIGKTVLVQKFILDWATGKANEDIMVIVPLPFRDLNLIKENHSLEQLLHRYVPELKGINITSQNKKLLLVFDGLDECSSPLEFNKNKNCFDVTKPVSVDSLLTNLIKGNLLPGALLWITSRPATANRIPAEYIDRVTEIRGFSHLQRKEYFKKRVHDESQANKIISHIKSSRSLYIMCHIPIFCAISATVLESIMNSAGSDEIPKTLTEMYAHFLLVQTNVKNKKYHGATENPKALTDLDRNLILKLGELAFQQLEKGNLIFYEDDLQTCGIDVRKVSDYSSACTEIFREEFGLYKEKIFSFVHLTFQEFLAALYAHIMCVTQNVNVFIARKDTDMKDKLELSDLHQSAVSKALQSKNGHLDLFLRFLLGLSVESNQTLLHSLTQGLHVREDDRKKTIQYIHQAVKAESSPDRIINLFHCLNELHDNSLEKEIHTALTSGTLSEKQLEPAQCSALAYVLLMSEEVQEELDMKMYKTSAAGHQRLLPVLRTCKSARLNECGLLSVCCDIVASALHSVNSPLRELDLSYNNLRDSGIEKLCIGVKSPNCGLLKLQLTGCGLSSESCQMLAMMLQSPNLPLVELDLSHNKLEDEGVDLLCEGVKSKSCKIQKLRLADCGLSYECCGTLAQVLHSENSVLSELDLSINNLRDSGVKLLCEKTPSNLQKLKLTGCGLSSESCQMLAKMLQSPNLPLVELDLSHNKLEDEGVDLLCEGLKSKSCKIQKLRLMQCALTDGCCSDLASVLRSPHSNLIELELSDNELKDSGMQFLCSGLEDPHCKIESLNLLGCLITENGCVSLAKALSSNTSELRELNLSYNHPGVLGAEQLTAVVNDPHSKLKKLNLDHGEDCRIQPGPRKYAFQLTLDQNTAHTLLKLSNSNRTVTGERVEHLHTKREGYPQILCEQAQTDRCYCEMEWSGGSIIGVTYKSEHAKGTRYKFPSLICENGGFCVRHSSKTKLFPHASLSNRVGVFINWAAGTLSYFSIINDTLIPLYTFTTTFTEPLYIAFTFCHDYSSVTLC